MERIYLDMSFASCRRRERQRKRNTALFAALSALCWLAVVLALRHWRVI